MRTAHIFVGFSVRFCKEYALNNSEIPVSASRCACVSVCVYVCLYMLCFTPTPTEGAASHRIVASFVALPSFIHCLSAIRSGSSSSSPSTSEKLIKLVENTKNTSRINKALLFVICFYCLCAGNALNAHTDHQIQTRTHIERDREGVRRVLRMC